MAINPALVVGPVSYRMMHQSGNCPQRMLRHRGRCLLQGLMRWHGSSLLRNLIRPCRSLLSREPMYLRGSRQFSQQMHRSRSRLRNLLPVYVMRAVPPMTRHLDSAPVAVPVWKTTCLRTGLPSTTPVSVYAKPAEPPTICRRDSARHAAIRSQPIPV